MCAQFSSIFPIIIFHACFSFNVKSVLLPFKQSLSFELLMGIYLEMKLMFRRQCFHESGKFPKKYNDYVPFMTVAEERAFNLFANICSMS